MRFSFAITLAVLLACASTRIEAQRFPKPSPAREFASMKIYGNDGSPIRVPREEWAEAAVKLPTGPGWSVWIDQRRRAMDAWMSEQRDKPEYIAGWWHDFVNDKDGAFLEWSPTPPADAPPKVFGGWVFGLRSRNGANMIEAARLWRVTNNLRYFDWAAGQLDFYAENYTKWPIQTAKSKSRLMHQSLDDANMLVRFVDTARILEGRVPEERRAEWAARKQRWINDLLRPMALLLDETLQRVHNIACWQRSAQAMAAIYAGDDELWKRAIDGEFGIRRQIRDGITSDYFWFEQSLGYNSYVVSALLPLFELAGLMGRLDELRDEAAAVENLMLAPVLLRFPDGRVPTPADTTGALRKAPEAGLLARARRVFPTHIGVTSATMDMSWENLLDPVNLPSSAPEARDSLPAVETRNLESSRFAILRKDGWQVFFHYGQLDRSHSQAEALNYEATFGDIDVTHDPGTVGYGSPLHRGYYTTAAAHNVPVIDGKGQQGWHEGELLAFDKDAAMVSARQSDYQPGIRATRTISIDDGALFETTRIEAADNQPHRLGIILHLQGRVTPPRDATVAGQSPFSYWADPFTWREGPVSTLKATIGGKPFAIRIEAPVAIKVFHAKVPDAPPNQREAIYVELEASSAQFRVTWKPE